MANVLGYAEPLKKNPQGEGRHRRKQWDQSVQMNSGKELYRQTVRLSSANAAQGNLNRIVLRDVKLAVKAGNPVFTFALKTRSPESQNTVAPLVGPKEISEFFSSGGPKAVLKVYLALRKRAVHGEVRLLEEALAEAMRSVFPDNPDTVESTPHQPDTFFDRVRRLDAKGRADAALDLLYDKIDAMMWGGDFLEIDSMISGVTVSDCSLDILLGVLTATLPARSKLPSRAKFFRDVDEILKQRGKYENGLLTGLE